ncbi:hypothetical protein [Paenibacillus humicus]|uniref:hypothetical protein n=1 Tax=Paenibacillus humicus TaxID=412861 RepID=UPI003F15C829
MGNVKPWPEEGKLKPDEEDALKRMVTLQLMRPVIQENRQKLEEYKGVLQRACRMTLEVFARDMDDELYKLRRKMGNERIHLKQVVPRRGQIVVGFNCRLFPGEFAMTAEEADYLRNQLVDEYIQHYFGSAL